jgi:simple sugar transport system permease protein
MLLQTQMNVSKDASDVLQGIILFFFLGCEFFIRYRISVRGKGGERHG